MKLDIGEVEPEVTQELRQLQRNTIFFLQTIEKGTHMY
jgi:hypothetical protein